MGLVIRCVFVCELLTCAFLGGPRCLYRNMYVTNFYSRNGSEVDEKFSRSVCVLI